jgi:hypothetical protein
MKRLVLSALVSTTLIFSATTFAAPSKQYYSTLGSSKINLSSTMVHPPVDISIINASSSSIYTVVPGSPINDLLNPGYNNHIYNYDNNVYYTYLVLQDVYHNSFYAYNVCKLAIVTVFGYTGHFTITTDNDLCN